jgi:hypothetical protein
MSNNSETTVIPITKEFSKKVTLAIEEMLKSAGQKYVIIRSEPEIEYLDIPEEIPVGTLNFKLKLPIIPDNLTDDIRIITHDTRKKANYKIKGGIYVKVEDLVHYSLSKSYSIPFI